jgi:hypothetical protein
MFRNHPEKRKQMFAINGSLIRYFKIGEDFELMAIAVKQNPLNIKYISNKYRYSPIYGATFVIFFRLRNLILTFFVIFLTFFMIIIVIYFIF